MTKQTSSKVKPMPDAPHNQEQRPIRVRLYQPEDRDLILSLAPRLTIGMQPYRPAADCLAAARDWIESSLTAHGGETMVFVAEDAGGPLGFASVTHETHFTGERQAYIGELATLKSAEGRGVGRALVGACEAWARQQGYRAIALVTGAANTRALGFYRRLGYGAEDVRLTRLLGE
jgi:ribosomal protein S18 acetylase RimI-like enzyme